MAVKIFLQNRAVYTGLASTTVLLRFVPDLVTFYSFADPLEIMLQNFFPKGPGDWLIVDHIMVQVVVKCVQSLSSIFIRQEVSVPFIKVLAPDVLSKIHPHIDLNAARCHSLNKISEDDAIVIQEVVRCLEMVLSNPHLGKGSIR